MFLAKHYNDAFEFGKVVYKILLVFLFSGLGVHIQSESKVPP